MRNGRSGLGIGVLTALASSLCCIAPLIAILAGSGSIASNFKWIEPLRPWLIGATILALGFAWYQHLKPQAEEDCACDVPKQSFWRGLPFLSGVTVFAALMLSFPLYADLFYPNTESASIGFVNPSQIEYVELEVSGMTCTGCETHVKHAVSELTGILEVEASYKEGSAVVKFDASQTNLEEIEVAIESIDYKVENATFIQSLNH